MAWSPLDPPEVPTVFRIFLICRTSRVTIMNMRMTLSEREIEKYEIPMLIEVITLSLAPDS